jgi:hypothetical protein
MEGFDWHENKNGFTVARLHYLAHPEKTKEWAEKQQKSYPSIDVWRQEMELDFTKASGRRVFPEFRSDLHVRDIQFNPYADMWRGWDFGYHRPACIWAQVDVEDRLLVLDEELGYEEVIDQFALKVKTKHKLYSFKDACDPAGKQVTDKGKDTSVSILKKMGVNPHMRPSRVEDGINIIRNLLLPRVDGSVSLLVHPRCKLLIDGFLGGYTRDEDNDEPVKDGYYDHLFDALRYMIDVIYDKKMYTPRRYTKPFIRIRKTASEVAGY